MAWLASEKAPVMTAWLAMTVATVANRIRREQGPARRQEIIGIGDRLGVGDDQRALAEIIEHQRGQHQEQPRRLDRPAAEMAHVGIERLGAGHGEENAAEHDEADRAMGAKERDPRRWAQRAQDDPGVGNVQSAEHGVDDERTPP